MARPDPPHSIRFWEIRQNEVFVEWKEGYNGGQTLREHQLVWAYEPGRMPEAAFPHNGYDWVGGLPTETGIWFSARTRNDAGWSDYAEWKWVHTSPPAKAPNAPPPPKLHSKTSSSIETAWGGDGYHNLGMITHREIWGSPVSNPNDSRTGRVLLNTNLVTGVLNDPTHNWANLASRTWYYFWARNYNYRGWSPLSSRVDLRTMGVPDAPHNPVLSDVRQITTKAKLSFDSKWNGDSSVLEYQIGFGTSTTTAQRFQSVGNNQIVTIAGLTPGVTYYFWSRARNAIGWSSWSGRSSVVLDAGARLLVGNTWKRAVPWVNVNGVWRVAKPYTKIAGVWKENI